MRRKQVRVKIYTIGFTQKSAEQFFGMLQAAGVHRVIDIRLNNLSQLAGFAKRDDLKYFLQAICGIEYLHDTRLAPTQDILGLYRKKEIEWSAYEEQFGQLLRERRIENHLDAATIDKGCLLCSEPEPDHCHRRLVAEYLQQHWSNVAIHHLQ